MKVKSQLKDAQLELTTTAPTKKGQIVYKTDTDEVDIGDGSGANTLVDKGSAQVVANKTVVVANNTITTAPSGNLTSTELNAALAELQGDIDANTTNLSDHEAESSGAHAASAISNTPSGNLAASTVQAALDELQTDVDTRATSTNADLTNPAIDVATLEEQGSTPSTPSIGDMKFYAKNDQKLYYLDSNGIETEVGAGAAGGTDTNYYEHYEADIANSSSVNIYDDGGSEPTNGSSGSPTTVSRSLETSNPIYGDNSIKLSKSAADGQGEGWAFPTIATDIAAESGRTQTVQFTYQTSANYADGDVTVWVYRVGSNTLEALNGFDGLGNYSNELKAAGSGVATFTSSFNFGSSDTQARVILHIATTNATAYDITVDHIFIGEKATLDLNAKSGTYTPTISATTNVASSTAGVLRWVQIDDKVFVSGNMNINPTSGSGTATQFEIDLPVAANLTDDNSLAGSGTFRSSEDSVRIYPETTNDTAIFRFQATTTGAGDIGFTFSYIADQSVGNILNSTQQDFQNVEVIVYSDNGPSVGTSNTKITYNQTEKDPFSAYSSGTFTAPASGVYSIKGSFFTDAESWSSGDGIFFYGYKNGALGVQLYGSRVSGHSSGETGSISGSIELAKGDTLEIYASSGVATNILSSGGRPYNYIHIKYEKPLSVIGNAGVPYEYISQDITSTTTAAADTEIDVTDSSITLSPGTWKIGYEAMLGVDENAGATQSLFGRLRITDSSNTYLDKTAATVGGTIYSGQIMYFSANKSTEITITEETTYKLRITCSHASANGVATIVSSSLTGSISGNDAASYIYAERKK